jgi:protease II
VAAKKLLKIELKKLKSSVPKTPLMSRNVLRKIKLKLKRKLKLKWSKIKSQSSSLTSRNQMILTNISKTSQTFCKLTPVLLEFKSDIYNTPRSLSRTTLTIPIT